MTVSSLNMSGLSGPCLPADRLRPLHQNGAQSLTYAQHEVVEGLVVDVGERVLHGQCEVSQVGQVLPALLVGLLLLRQRAAARASTAGPGPSPQRPPHPSRTLCRAVPSLGG